MSIWCCKNHAIYHPISVRIFIKHLVTSKTPIWSYNRTNRKAITTTTIKSLSSPHFENLTSHQKEQISVYANALLEWNQRMNLTAVAEMSEVMTRHVDDSLAIIPPIQNTYLSHSKSSSCESLNLVDVGSGPGLPGLIFAIACPSWKVTLLESMNKRCLFLEHAISVTGLTNVQVLRARAEVLHQGIGGNSAENFLHFLVIVKNVGQKLEFREVFDVAVARAVAEMRVLAEYCLPLVRVGGLFVAAKGHDPQVEVGNAEKAIQLMGASILQLYSVESHSPYGQRTAIICLKERPTPKKYPRDPGTPSKSPL